MEITHCECGGVREVGTDHGCRKNKDNIDALKEMFDKAYAYKSKQKIEKYITDLLIYGNLSINPSAKELIKELENLEFKEKEMSKEYNLSLKNVLGHKVGSEFALQGYSKNIIKIINSPAGTMLVRKCGEIFPINKVTLNGMYKLVKKKSRPIMTLEEYSEWESEILEYKENPAQRIYVNNTRSQQAAKALDKIMQFVFDLTEGKHLGNPRKAASKIMKDVLGEEC